MVASRGTLPEVYETRIAKLIFQAHAMDEQVYPKMFKIVTSTRGHEDAFEVTGLGTFVLKPEGEPIAVDDPIQGPRRRVAHQTFGLGFRHTMEALDDAQYDVIMRMPSDLGRSANDHQDELAVGLVNDFFAGATHTAMDGLSIINTAHVILKPRAGGPTTQSNQLNPGVALSVTGMESAFTILRGTLSQEGRPVGQRLAPKTLLIHQDNEFVAATILETERGRPGTTDHDTNTMRSSRTGVQMQIWTRLTDTDDWTLWADKINHEVTWYSRKRLTPDSSVDTGTKDRIHDAHYRASVAVRNRGQGLVGSQV